MSRVEETVKNSIVSLIIQVVTVVLTFVTRTVLIKTMGEQYLGINGLFGNILNMLSLAELGVGTTIMYFMYKPMVECDEQKISILMSVYAKVYNTIGVVIMLAGLIIAPFLGVFMKEVPDIPHLTLIFILYVMNMSASYFFSYKSSIINVAQKNYIVNTIRFLFMVVQTIVQLFVLILTRNYILYYSCSILFSVLANLAVAAKANRMFPYLKKPVKGHLDSSEKKQIIKDISAMFSHNIGTFVVYSTDNLIIAKFIGIIEVGFYSNYTIILTAVSTFLNLLFDSLTASVGNLMHSESKEKSYDIFRNVFFATCWLVGFCAVCLFVLYNPFITLWIGEKYTFQGYVVFFIVLNFYLGLIRRPVNTFKHTVGLFWNDRYKPLCEATVNLVTSLILVKYFGICGVFMGTTISTLTVCIWLEPYILYKNFYKKNVWEYFSLLMKYMAVPIISIIIIQGISKLFYEITIGSFSVQMLLCVTVPNLLFYLLFRNTTEMEYMKEILERILNRIRRKNIS